MHTQPDTHMPRGGKTYRALLSQTGTNAPTAKVLFTSLPEELQFSYNTIGEWNAFYPIGSFDANKTIINIGAKNTNMSGTMELLADITGGNINLHLVDGNTPTNGTGGDIPIEITVYN